MQTSIPLPRGGATKGARPRSASASRPATVKVTVNESKQPRRRRRQKASQPVLTDTFDQVVSAPTARSLVTTRRVQKNSHVEHFSDYVAACSFPANTAAGDLVVNLVETLQNFGARAALLAGLYQRWRFRRLKFRYVSEVPTSQAGSLTMAHIDDASYTLTGALALLNQPGSTYTNAQISLIRSLMSEADGSKTFPVWTPFVDMPVRCKKEWMYTSGANLGSVTANLNANGVLLAICNSAYTGTTPCGRIYAEGTLEFDKPLFNALASTLLASGYVVSSVTASSGGHPLEFTVANASGSAITADFLIWIPSDNFQVGGSGGNSYVKKNLPAYLAYNANGAFYELFSSVEDYLATLPQQNTGAITGGAVDSLATIYSVPSFS